MEAFIYAWGIVESDIDMLVLEQLNLLDETKNLHPKRGDERVRFVLASSFRQKVEFLTRRGRISERQARLLEKLTSRRNELVHGGNFSMMVQRLTEHEKREYLNLASQGLRVALYGEPHEHVRIDNESIHAESS